MKYKYIGLKYNDIVLIFGNLYEISSNVVYNEYSEIMGVASDNYIKSNFIKIKEVRTIKIKELLDF